jgi:transcriptional antiterminator RfaH
MWIVGVTKANSETTAEYNLKKQGYGVYLPRYVEKEGKEIKIKVLFPRYIFIEIYDKWYSILNTRGISSILMSDQRPSPVPEKVINELKSRQDKKGFVTIRGQEKFSVGDKIILADGLFKGYSGLVDGMRDADRVNVLLDVLGRKVVLNMDTKSVAVVTSGNKEVTLHG